MIFKNAINFDNLDKFQKRNLKLILLALLFTTFSGALRKWVVDSGFVSNIILLLQLIVPLIIVLLFKKIAIGKTTTIVLFLYMVALIIAALNPLNHTIYHGVLGIILHLGFWLPLMVYTDNKNRFPVEVLDKLLSILLITQFVLATFQYQLPGNHILNIYAQDKAFNSAPVGMGTRVSGTFSFLSGYTAFLALAGFFLWSYGIDSKKKNFLYQLFIIILLISSLMSGSRASLILSLTLIFFSLFPLLKVTLIKKGFRQGLIIASIGLLVANNFNFFQQTIENFWVRVNRGLELNEYETRTYGILEEVINYRGSFPLTGSGLGATYQGANAIWGESKYTKNYKGGYEEEPERIILEGGFILLFIKFFLFWYVGQRLLIPKLYWAILFVYQFIGFPLVFNTYNAFYFYLGLMLVDRAYLNYYTQRTTT